MNIKLPKEVSDFIEANASATPDPHNDEQMIYILPAYKKIADNIYEAIPLNKLKPQTWRNIIGTVFDSPSKDKPY